MRNRNSVRQLGRSHAHRKAMYENMATSLFLHERIVTTKEKGKELKKITERLITRAKRNLLLTDEDVAGKLHNKREVMRHIRNRDVVKKLFEDIAPRFKSRNGGYTRMYLLGRRAGDAAEMAIVELVDRKVPEPVKKEKETDKGKSRKEKTEKKEKK